MGRSQFAKQPFRLLGQRERHASAIGVGWRLDQKSCVDHSGDQFRGGVRGDEEAFGDGPHTRKLRTKVTGDGQQGLMLLRRQTNRRRSELAEREEASQFITEIRQRRILR